MTHAGRKECIAMSLCAFIPSFVYYVCVCVCVCVCVLQDELSQWCSSSKNNGMYNMKSTGTVDTYVVPD